MQQNIDEDNGEVSRESLDERHLGQDQEDDDEDDDEEGFVYRPSSPTQDERPAMQTAIDDANIVAAEPHGDDASAADEDEEEEFAYPSSSTEAAPHTDGTIRDPEDVQREHTMPQVGDAAPSDEPATAPIPIDYSQLHQLCLSGALESLQQFFAETIETSQVSSFVLANEPNPTSGLMPIHYAAKEGKVETLKWLISDVGALVEIEDREGETALHKAALAGRLPALTYLLSCGADADSADADGWTALHNACSRGYLDIVRYLCENADATPTVRGGRGGWTPLMNAASNGHLPIVRYLTAKLHVDPFQRNAAGETAYDVAAASFEIYICEVLERYETDRWKALKFMNKTPASTSSTSSSSVAKSSADGPYNPLYLHTTVPVIIHQNERLDTRLSTLAVHGAKPRWSGTHSGRLTKPDRRAPGTLAPSALSSATSRGGRPLPMRREDVQLPVRDQPYKLRLPTRRKHGQEDSAGAASEDQGGSTPTPTSVLQERSSSQDPSEEASHFWLCDWQIDRTHPLVDPVEGWQYAQSFDAPEDKWYAQVPQPLTRLLEGKGLSSSITRAISGGTLPGPGQSSSGADGDNEATATGWVRRRRWIRCMRRRLDLEFGDELESAELSSASASASATAIHAELDENDVAGHEAARADCDRLPADADYIARAKALAGAFALDGVTPADVMGESTQMLRARETRLELGIKELRQHAFEDEVVDRRSSAEGLLKEFTLQLGQLRQASGLNGDEDDDDDTDDDDDDFIYPNSFKDTQSVITRIAGLGGSGASTAPRPGIGPRQASAASVFGDFASTSGANTRSQDLARATEFRVPTHDAPNPASVAHSGSILQQTSLIPTWEDDNDARECRGCSRKFTFFNRKHHCRRCGRIFCADCSSQRAHLSADELVIDPAMPEMLLSESMGASRICASCHAERQLPPALRTLNNVLDMAREDAGGPYSVGDQSQQGPLSQVSSRASELNECPVCGATLAQLGSQSDQEAHVKTCLENGGGGSIQSGRYIVYRLPSDSPIIGRECVICLEELLGAQPIARLPCLCFFHKNCIDSWLARGRACPTHAR